MISNDKDTISQMGLAYHDAFLKHDAGPGHPERALRISEIMTTLKQTDWWKYVEVIEAREATQEEVSLVHDPKYVEAMRRLCDAGGQFLPSMQAAVGPETYPAALRAVGAGLTLADNIMDGRWKLGFAPVRPPGHHAIYSRPRGCCVFNNISILAKYLISKYSLSRIAIIDFDVHHGNGTEEAFWTDPRVLFCSIHQRDLFPSDTGDWYDKGEGEGLGFTINIPIATGTQDKDFLKAFDSQAMPDFLDYKPEIVLVSSGFDGHWMDIQGGLKLTEGTYVELAKRISEIARKSADSKIISILEGGYDISGCIQGVNHYLKTLLDEQNA